jgi:hypothetical protein
MSVDDVIKSPRLVQPGAVFAIWQQGDIENGEQRI